MSLPAEIALLETDIQDATKRAFLAEENVKKAESTADEEAVVFFRDELIRQLDWNCKLSIKKASKLKALSLQEGEFSILHVHAKLPSLRDDKA